jgi:hypothetical protein
VLQMTACADRDLCFGTERRVDSGDAQRKANRRAAGQRKVTIRAPVLRWRVRLSDGLGSEHTLPP